MRNVLSPTSTPTLLKQVSPLPINELLPDEDAKPVKKEAGIVKRIASFLLKAQKYSAYAFLGFFGLHISATVVAPGLGVSQKSFQDCFEMTRSIYMLPIFEYPFVYGAAAIHLSSGIIVRALRFIESEKRRGVIHERNIVIQDERREDIGLGGIGSIFGFGFKKSWISQTIPSLTPLTFSGYITAIVLGYHTWKMKWAPMLVDGDSSLISLNFITHYLNQSINGRSLAIFNFGMLALLLWVSFYHIVSGLFRYRRQFSSRAKKIAYGVITVFTSLSFIGIGRFVLWPLELGFIGSQFNKYLMK